MAGLTALVSSRVVQRIDGSADRVAAHFRGRTNCDRVMYGLSESANHSLLWHGINAVDALAGGPDHRRAALRRSAILAVEQTVVNGVVKSLVRRTRPSPPGVTPHRLRRPRTSSFPSGHASAGACAATLLSQDLGGQPLWWSTALVVSWSRIHVGVHYLSDVLAGLLVGRLLGLLAVRLWPPATPRPLPAPLGVSGDR